MSSSVCYRRASRATVYFHVPWSPCSWCMYARPSSTVPCIPFHPVRYFHSTQAQPIRLVAFSTYSRAPLPRKCPITPLAGLLPPLVTRCSPSTFLFRWQAVLISTHDACSPPICVGLFGIVCVDGVMVLSLCGLICPCCWAGEYVRTRCPRCPSLNPANGVSSTFE